MLILGIDPGLASTGWGVVEYCNGRIRPVSFGVVKTDSKDTIQNRICTIVKDVEYIANKYKAEVCSMEDIYFCKNITSAVPVAKVIGALTYKLQDMGIPVHYFSPLQIKTAVTGTGTADKHQVQELVKLQLKLKTVPKPDHAADALADCICWISYNGTNERLGLNK